MLMNIQIASRLYYSKYRLLFSYDGYLNLLNKGLLLIQAESLQRHCDVNELRAINIALDYNIEAMERP